MTAQDVEAIVAAQAGLIAALDSGDVASIEAQTAALSNALAVARAHGAPSPVAPGRVDLALRQGDAARTRVAFLADRNRRKLDALKALRGGNGAEIYTMRGGRGG